MGLVRRSLIGGSVALIAGLIGAGPVQAATTVTFNFTGAEQTFTGPVGRGEPPRRSRSARRAAPSSASASGGPGRARLGRPGRHRPPGSLRRGRRQRRLSVWRQRRRVGRASTAAAPAADCGRIRIAGSGGGGRVGHSHRSRANAGDEPLFTSDRRRRRRRCSGPENGALGTNGSGGAARRSGSSGDGNSARGRRERRDADLRSGPGPATARCGTAPTAASASAARSGPMAGGRQLQGGGGVARGCSEVAVAQRELRHGPAAPEAAAAPRRLAAGVQLTLFGLDTTGVPSVSLTYTPSQQVQKEEEAPLGELGQEEEVQEEEALSAVPGATLGPK